MVIITARAMMMMTMMIIQFFIFNMLTKYLQESVTKSAQPIKTYIYRYQKKIIDGWKFFFIYSYMKRDIRIKCFFLIWCKLMI